jgi:hypothetical protein
MKAPAGVHEDFSREEAVQGSSNRVFGLTIAAALTIVAAWPLVRQRPVRWWAVAVALVFLGAAIISPQILGPLNRLWLRLGLLLQRIVTPAIMALLYYGTVTPIALALRLGGKDLLRLRLDRGAASYWLPRQPPGPAPDTMRQQF